jgi:hypothetical protein
LLLQMFKRNTAHYPAVALGVAARADYQMFRHRITLSRNGPRKNGPL